MLLYVNLVLLHVATELKMVFLLTGHVNLQKQDADSKEVETNKNPISEILKSGSLINR
ncbi:hypothetical protein DEU39_1959 [Chryseobacterium sp. AG363]|nr:hypothetical protein DEU39_1959 [Chryseobacterium sp. AG363]